MVNGKQTKLEDTVEDPIMDATTQAYNEMLSMDRKLALALDPLFGGLHGKKQGKMKTLAEVRFEILKRLEQQNS